MICPRCDEQGLIYSAKVTDLGVMLYICDECDACWLRSDVIKGNNFKDLSQFLEEHGLTYENVRIEDLGYIDDTSERKKSFFNLSSSNDVLSLIDEAWG